MKTWWTCPKCKAYKMIEDSKSCVRCSECGRFFDKRNNEMKANRSVYSLIPEETQCDLG